MTAISMSRTARHVAFGVVVALVVAGSVLALRQAPKTPAAQDAVDPVARLQQKIDSGAVALQFDSRQGYLASLLKELEIPVSSQSLVFSKSSEQEAAISPQTPRALYFNDDTYVAWVQGGAIELAAVDPKSGSFFYTLTQEKEAHPKFERHMAKCVGCHDSSEDPSRLIPRLLMLSVVPDRQGRPINGAAVVTTDRSPFKERWGGWYVSGTHGAQTHMGNQTFTPPAREITSIPDFIANLDLTPGANVTDLTSRFDTKPYPIPHSDIVALMVLAHQTHVHNLIMFAAYNLKAALDADPKTDTASLVKELGEPVVRAMLFSGEERLAEPIAGTSGFAAEFVRAGPRDPRGRSLRDLDLKTRLLRYPLSYVIYSDSFDQMPGVLKEFVYRRLREVLTGSDTSAPFAHLSVADRENILAILKDTKPDFR
jgi:hypothetical protein